MDKNDPQDMQEFDPTVDWFATFDPESGNVLLGMETMFGPVPVFWFKYRSTFEKFCEAVNRLTAEIREQVAPVPDVWKKAFEENDNGDDS